MNQHTISPNVKIDLTNCDREPIHILGTVQSHGLLMVCKGPDWKIVHASNNAEIIFGADNTYILDQNLEWLIGTEAMNSIRNSVEQSKDAQKARVFNLKLINNKVVHASISSHAGRLLVEFEPVDGNRGFEQPLDLVESLISKFEHAGSVNKFCDIAVERVRALMRYDRVMVYKFLHDGSGQVISEAKRPDIEPFLGLRYPASDIPQQARAMYLKSWIRMIADVNSKPVPITPQEDASGQPIDLTFAQLRSVSPIHIEYLQNMGVTATMSFSIIVGGKLWGMIVCHHNSPLIIGADVRAAAELFAQIFSLQIENIEPNEHADVVRLARVHIDQVLAEFPTSGDLIDNLSSRFNKLRALMPCDGIGLWVDGIWKSEGSTPPANDIPALARFVSEASNGDIFATHELSSRFPSASGYAHQASGILCIPLSRVKPDFIMLFRMETIHSVKWGGNPEKPVIAGPNGDRLTPRKSFEAWEKQVKEQSHPWNQANRLTASAFKISMLEVVLRLNDVAARERSAATERQRLLIAELNHRVKNVLALVSSLVARGQQDGQTINSFIRGLQGRIRSLAFAHDQATFDGAGSLRSLFLAEAAPYQQNSTSRIVLSEQEIAIDAHAYSVLALVAHEMMTNAAKYGALSVQNSLLKIEWHLDVSGSCVIEWHESGGPAVQAPEKTGFGTTLIERQIPHELGGQADIHYEMTGLHARFVIPAKHVLKSAAVKQVDELSRPSEFAKTSGTLSGLNILLVEDSLLIALDAEFMMQDAGASSVKIASSAEEALGVIAKNSFDVAVLDINLGRGTSMPVADELLKIGTPFVFATGYNDANSIPERFRHIAMIAKPYSVASLTSAIGKAVGER